MNGPVSSPASVRVRRNDPPGGSVSVFQNLKAHVPDAPWMQTETRRSWAGELFCTMMLTVVDFFQTSTVKDPTMCSIPSFDRSNLIV